MLNFIFKNNKTNGTTTTTTNNNNNNNNDDNDNDNNDNNDNNNDMPGDPGEAGRHEPLPVQVYILQRGVQWKQGAVICMVLYTILLYGTTPIHCTRTPL